MPHHREKRIVPYTAEQMFDLVADVEQYPKFLPWCVASRIKSRAEASFVADLIVAFGAFRGSFTSRVNVDRAGRMIGIEYLAGPFKHLTNVWRFQPREEGGSTVEIDIDFAFKSRMLEALMSTVFNKAIDKMTAAFETRAAALYGTAAAPAPSSPSSGAGD